MKKRREGRFRGKYFADIKGKTIPYGYK
jgi:hypothetical protein